MPSGYFVDNGQPTWLLVVGVMIFLIVAILIFGITMATVRSWLHIGEGFAVPPSIYTSGASLRRFSEATGPGFDLVRKEGFLGRGNGGPVFWNYGNGVATDALTKTGLTNYASEADSVVTAADVATVKQYKEGFKSMSDDALKRGATLYGRGGPY